MSGINNIFESIFCTMRHTHCKTNHLEKETRRIFPISHTLRGNMVEYYLQMCIYSQQTNVHVTKSMLQQEVQLTSGISCYQLYHRVCQQNCTYKISLCPKLVNKFRFTSTHGLTQQPNLVVWKGEASSTYQTNPTED